MFQSLGKVTLKSGEVVDCAAVRAPDDQWLPRIKHLLGHKPVPYDWQIAQMLSQDLGLDVTFYILSRGESVFTNITIVSKHGVGILGHVYTAPQDRRKHAASLLMKHQMEHFRQTGGRALYLGTEFDSAAYHIYIEHGFLGIEERSGVMSYFPSSEQKFLDSFFTPAGLDDTAIEPVGWQHYPLATPLTIGKWPEMLRLTAHGIVGRVISEGPMLPMIRANTELAVDEPPAAWAMRHLGTGAVLGMATCTPDPLWPRTSVVDVYCHPDQWGRACDLLAKLTPPADTLQIAYVDEDSPCKRAALEAAGFVRVAALPHFATDTRSQAPRHGARILVRE